MFHQKYSKMFSIVYSTENITYKCYCMYCSFVFIINVSIFIYLFIYYLFEIYIFTPIELFSRPLGRRNAPLLQEQPKSTPSSIF